MITKTKIPAKKAKPIPVANVALWEDLKDAASEVRLRKKGNLQLKTAQDLLNELELDV
jgi:hypothetical protein